MKKQNVLGLVLATSLALTSLAGCQVPGMAGQTPSGTNATGGQQQPGGQTAAAQPTKTETREGAAVALAEEREMDDLDYAAGDSTAAAYAVAMVGQPKPREGEVAITATGGAEAGEGEVAITATGGGEAGADLPEAEAGVEAQAGMTAKPGPRAERQQDRRAALKDRRAALKDKLAGLKEKLEKRKMERKAKVEARLAKIKGAADKVREKAKAAAWVDNGDGTESKTLSANVEKSVNGKAANKSYEFSRTRDSETKVLIGSTVKLSQTLPNGMSRLVERTKTLNEDGTYTVVFHSEHTFKDGRKRVADWTKTIAVDGTVSGTGTIVWTDKDGNEVKKTEVTLNGTEDAPEAEAGGEEVTADAPEAAVEGDAPEAAVEGDASAEAEGDATTEAKVEDGEAEATAETEVEAEAGATADAEATA
ncbi:MAG: hypothetical protein ACLGIN_07800 [Candidatus Sericytochromatia bacterium]